MCADMPLIEEAVVSKIYHHLSSKKNLEGVAATFETERPEGLGRIKRSDKGFAIIEHKDCSSSELLIKEANSGFYILDTEFVKNNLDSISNQNKSNEFYLTDLFTPEQDVFAFCFKTDDYFLGVNNQFQKQAVLRRLKERKNKSLIKKGVLIDLPEQVYIEWDVEIGAGTQISPNTFIYGKTTIDEGVVIEPGVIIKNSQIASGSTIFGNSYLEEASVGRSSKIGPMARLRPGTEIGDECKIGNFVEVKKAVFERGAQASHLSYIGDARIGEGTNLGCGFITCNYDGKNKHRTEIGKNCFIAAGSTVTQSLDSGDFAIARTRQVTKQGMANKFIKSKD
jgi:bifunctional UDP-N-acetylglucosamine pyrophosphorylase/glucosamine-1-phosphate N-acetyltransferase